jgi:maleate cis-trans isomerase
VNRIPCVPTITPETLQAMESEIARVASLILPELSVNVMACSCTSGSLFIGSAAIHELIHRAHPHTVCTTPIDAVTAVLRALKASRIALFKPYAVEINQRLRGHLRIIFILYKSIKLM